jgi:hypothetical protein
MDTMGAMIDTFTNGIDAVRARNKALDSLQLGLFIGLAPFFNAFGELKGGVPRRILIVDDRRVLRCAITVNGITS